MGYTLRVSVLEQCQLRCNYCLPREGELRHQQKNWLTLSQYEKIAAVLKPLFIEKVRFTGGEPLLRPDLSAIIKVFSRSLGGHLALTTNGLRFSSMKYELVEAGLTSVTFHLDTLRENRYGLVMGRGSVQTVLDAINDAHLLDLDVKLNMVVQRGINDDEILDFLQFAKKREVEVRFIELMNTGSARNYVAAHFMSGQDILKAIEKTSPLISLGRQPASAPAEKFLAKNLGVPFGLIASDTQPFCAHCNRLRLSADGRLRTCLYQPEGHSLKSSSDEMPDEDELLRRIMEIVARKTSFHPGLKKNLRDFSMSQIGG